MCAGNCTGLKLLKEEFERGGCCPHCKAEVTGLRRYGRVIKKAQADLTDQKFAVKIVKELQLADDRLMKMEAADIGALKHAALASLCTTFSAILQESLKSPSMKVRVISSISTLRSAS
jgi:hypothetical protein